MKNNDPETQNLKDLLSKLVGFPSEKETLQRLSTETATRHATLAASCDLGDAGEIGEIGRLQIVKELLPYRLAAIDQAETDTESALLKEVHRFAETDLIPKIRSLRQKTEGKMKTELQSIFPNAETLTAAISSSALVSGLEKLAFSSSIQAQPFDGVLKYARRMLDNWEQAKTFEAKTS